MTATIDALASAVAGAINAADWAPEFTAEYTLTPVIVRENMGSALKCFVVPGGHATAGRFDRRRSKIETTIDVGFAVAIGSESVAAVQPWLQFVENVFLWFDELQLELSGHVYQRAEFDPLYDPARLRNDAIFFSVLAVTWRRY